MELSTIVDAAVYSGAVLLAGRLAYGAFLQRREDPTPPELPKSLREVEETIRSLIRQAGEATADFDKIMKGHRGDLEALLKRIESAKSQKPRSEPLEVRGAQNADETTIIAKPPAPRSAKPAPIDISPPKAEPPAAERAPTPALREAIEVSGDEIDENERQTFSQLSIVDPVTYRIARRLLSSGKEIHVVARKLELPVSEVRLLDRLMRREQRPEESSAVDAPAEQPPVQRVNLEIGPTPEEFEPEFTLS